MESRKKKKNWGEKRKEEENKNQGGRSSGLFAARTRTSLSDVLIELEIPLNVERKIAHLYI